MKPYQVASWLRFAFILIAAGVGSIGLPRFIVSEDPIWLLLIPGGMSLVFLRRVSDRLLGVHVIRRTSWILYGSGFAVYIVANAVPRILSVNPRLVSLVAAEQISQRYVSTYHGDLLSNKSAHEAALVASIRGEVSRAYHAGGWKLTRLEVSINPGE